MTRTAERRFLFGDSMQLSSPSTWRTHKQVVSTSLFLLVPDVVFSRRVNQASFSYPIFEITFDNPDGNPGSFSDVAPGMTIRVLDASGTHKAWGYIREAATSTLLKFNPMSQGDIEFADNDRIIVYDSFQLWSKIPHIDNNGVSFKHWNIAFNASTAQPPVANLGPWYGNQVDPDTEVITVDFDGTGSFPVASGATITGYLWDVQDGTITVGTSTSSQITATFPAGKRWVKLTVTDSNGNTHTARALVVGVDEDEFPAVPHIVRRLDGEVSKGWEAAFELLTPDASAYPPGTAVIFWATERYGATKGSLNGYAGRQHVKFTGWVVDDNTKFEPRAISDYLVNAESALGIMGRLPAFGSLLQRSATPATWSDCADLNWWRHALYLMHWHSTLLEVCDLERPAFYTEYPLLRISSTTGSLADQFQFVVKAAAGQFTCDQRGRIYARKDPHLMSESERSALTTILTLQDTDWVEAIGIQMRHRPQVAWMWAYAIVASATEEIAKKAAAPGSSPGQGEGQETLNGLLVTSQADLNQRLGKIYATRNQETERFPIQVANMGMVADPAWQEFVAFTTTAYNKRGISYSAQRFVLVGVNVRYDGQRGVSSETWIVEPVVPDAVADGITVVMPGDDPPEEGDYIDSDGTYIEQPLPPYEDVFPYDYIPNEVADGEVEGSLSALAWNEELALTDNADAADPDWEPITLTGDVVDAARDNADRALVITDEKLYDIRDLSTTPDAILRQTISNMSLIRKIAGQPDSWGIYLTGIANPTSATDNFTSGLGPDTAFTSATFPFGGFGNGGVWSSTGGRTDAGCVAGTDVGVHSGTNRHEADVFIDLGEEYTVTAVSMYHKHSAANKPWGWAIKGWDASKSLVTTFVTGFNGLSTTSYTQRSFTGSQAGVRYVSFTSQMNTADGNTFIDELSISYTGGKVQVKFTDDGGIGIDSTQDVGTYVTGEIGYDCDDHNKGLHVAACAEGIRYTQTYTGSFLDITGLSVPIGDTKVVFIRVPYLRLDTQALNDDENSMQFIYGVDTPITGQTVFLATLDMDTGIATEEDITPIISGTTYIPLGASGNQFETFGGNTAKMLLAAEPDGGGTDVLLGSSNGGAAWSTRQSSFPCSRFRFEEPDQGGDGNRVWLAVDDTIYFSDDFGATVQDKTNDFLTETTGTEVHGVLLLS